MDLVLWNASEAEPCYDGGAAAYIAELGRSSASLPGALCRMLELLAQGPGGRFRP
jgi:hypothetical protein